MSFTGAILFTLAFAGVVFGIGLWFTKKLHITISALIHPVQGPAAILP